MSTFPINTNNHIPLAQKDIEAAVNHREEITEATLRVALLPIKHASNETLLFQPSEEERSPWASAEEGYQEILAQGEKSVREPKAPTSFRAKGRAKRLPGNGPLADAAKFVRNYFGNFFKRGK